ncbi:Hypothetical predicted protein [Pelobates cultripes]|uniref:Zinc-finger CCCH domain-containing protein n=2 Tax=Pelobates cultripes TaxID=61616 RepID=A0AAD1W2A4_PELCU|nr:Hypothetical predicted protein [Pelobates cultripes]
MLAYQAFVFDKETSGLRLQHCSVPCSWEHRPVGCMKMNCTFIHKKPRSINGLFLPPTASNSVIADNQESVVLCTDEEDSPLKQEYSWIPIHPPVIINLSEDDYEDEEEQTLLKKLECREKTPEEVEEEKLIIDICYKAGDYYKTPIVQDFQSKIEPVPNLLQVGDSEEFYCGVQSMKQTKIEDLSFDYIKMNNGYTRKVDDHSLQQTNFNKPKQNT